MSNPIRDGNSNMIHVALCKNLPFETGLAKDFCLLHDFEFFMTFNILHNTSSWLSGMWWGMQWTVVVTLHTQKINTNHSFQLDKCQDKHILEASVKQCIIQNSYYGSSAAALLRKGLFFEISILKIDLRPWYITLKPCIEADMIQRLMKHLISFNILELKYFLILHIATNTW